jgi:hypothetical protein
MLPACYASNVVAVDDRAVALSEQQLEFRPAVFADFDGLFESTRIEGEAAASLRKVWYWFAQDGTYSGAALVDGDEGPAFQTLRGRFRVDGSSLVLDDADPVPAESAAGFLRIRAAGGSLLLHRLALS